MIADHEKMLDKRPIAISAGIPALCFLVTTAYLGVSLDPFTPIKLIVLKLCVVGGLLSWLNMCVINRRVSIVATPLDIPIVLYGVWIAISGIWALNGPLWMEQLTLYSCGAGLFYLIVFFYRSTESAYRLTALMLLPIPVVTLLGIADLMNKHVFLWDIFFINKFFNVFKLLDVPGQFPRGWAGHFNGRISSTFGNPVYLAGWTVMLLPTALALLIEGRTLLMKLWAAVSVAMLSFMTAASFTRSSWISCAAALIMFSAILIKKQGIIDKKQLLWLIVTIVISASIPACVYLKPNKLNTTRYSIEERVESIASTNDPSMKERELIWRVAIDMAAKRPLHGYGAGNFESMQPFYLVKYFKEAKWARHASFPDRVHNEYLDILVETGAVGLALFLALLFFLGKAGVEAVERGGTISVLSAGLLSGGAGLMVYSCAQFPLHVITTGTYAWVFAALIVILGYGDRLQEHHIPMGSSSSRLAPVLSNISLFMLFLAMANSLFPPLLGQIAFQWGLYETRPGHTYAALKLMKMGIDTHPGDNEMSARYCMAANNGANNEKNSDSRNAILTLSAEEAARGLSYNPNDSRLYLAAGLAQIKLNNAPLAIKMLENSVVLNPKEPIAFYNLGIAQYIYARYNYAVNDKVESKKRFYRALMHFKKAMEMAPRLPGLYSSAGQTLYQLGRHKEALKYFNRAEKIDGESKELYNYIGMSLAALGEYDRAVSAYRSALSIDPEYSSAAGNLGIAFIDSGRFEQAISELSKVAAREPANGLARLQLGRALHSAKRDAEALEELKKAEHLLPEPEPAIELIKEISGGYKTR